MAGIDLDHKLITMQESPAHLFGYRNGQWWYAFNALCELDQPGEYYLDREAGVLYFWPPSSIQDAFASVSVAAKLVEMQNTSHVTFAANLLDQEPLFMDEEHQDFRLQRESPAYALGFTDIPIEKIGVYRSELRASWPVTSEIRPMVTPKP